MSGEVYPPLYPFLLKMWMSYFGTGVVAMRSLSALAGIGVVVATILWARDALGRGPAFVAGLIVCLSPLALGESREIRMYVLESLFATIAWWLLWRLLARRARRSVQMVTAASAALAVAAELWTMPTGLFIFLIQVSVVAVFGIRVGRARSATIAVLLGGASYIPWLSATASLALADSQFWTPRPTVGSIPSTFLALLGGWRDSPPSLVVPLAIVVGAFGLLLLYHDDRPEGRATAWAVTGNVGLVVVWWVAAMVRSGYDARYLGAALPGLALAISAGGAWLWGTATHHLRVEFAAIGLVTLVVCYGSIAVAFEEDWTRDEGVAPARQVARTLERSVQPGDVILVVDSRSYFSLAFELQTEHGTTDWSSRLWLSPSLGEPTYFGGALIDRARRIDPSEVPNGIPGLSPDGSIWTVALANGEHELDTFEALLAGRVRVIDVVTVRGVNATGSIFRITSNGR
jgi:hypothetical protein